MRSFSFFAIVLFYTFSVFGQSASVSSNVAVGDILVIGVSEDNSYDHINFPKENFIIKRGGIASFKTLSGTSVQVLSLSKNKFGTTVVKIRRKDSGRFFGSHLTVTAQLEPAISSGELVVVQ